MPKTTSAPYKIVTAITGAFLFAMAFFAFFYFVQASIETEVESELVSIRWLIVVYAIARFYGYLIKLPERTA